MVNHWVMWLNWGCKWSTNGLCGSIGDVNGEPMGYVAQLGV